MKNPQFLTITLVSLMFVAGNANAITPVPCSGSFDPSKTNTLCAVKDIPINGAHYDALFSFDLFSNVYPGDPPDFDVTTEAAAVSLMNQSAAVLNQYSAQYSSTYGINPVEPPLLFGPNADTYFKIAYDYRPVEQAVYTDFSGFLYQTGTTTVWEIVPTLRVVPSNVPNTWVTFAPSSSPKVPAPLSIAGAVTSFSLSRKLRKRIKLANRVPLRP